MDVLNEISLSGILSTLIYSFLGLILMLIAYGVIEKMTPFSVRKEIEEDQNTSLGIIIGCMMLGIALIIAATIMIHSAAQPFGRGPIARMPEPPLLV